MSFEITAPVLKCFEVKWGGMNAIKNNKSLQVTIFVYFPICFFAFFRSGGSEGAGGRHVRARRITSGRLGRGNQVACLDHASLPSSTCRLDSSPTPSPHYFGALHCFEVCVCVMLLVTTKTSRWAEEKRDVALAGGGLPWECRLEQ